jgi:D-amino peptidase
VRIYISVDMEGASGVTRWEDVIRDGQDYQAARRWMTGDVNAAIAGAREAGATDFVVEENHGVEALCNIVLDEIDEEAVVVRGQPRHGGTTAAALDESFDAMFLVGHHAKAGDRIGFCAHTIDYGGTREVRIGGRPVSEGEIFSLIAAQHAVPTALVCGDDVIAAELEARVPGIEAAVVKRAMSRTGGAVLPIRRAHDVIRTAATRAVERVKAGEIEVPPYEPPFRFEVELRQPLAEAATANATGRGIAIVDERTVAFEHDEMSMAYRMAIFCCSLSNGAGNRGW